MVGGLGNSSYAFKHYQKTEKKWKRDLKDLKKQNKILFSMFKRLGSHRELKKIKKIKTKAYTKSSYSSSNMYSTGT